jgi:hypothetical protein
MADAVNVNDDARQAELPATAHVCVVTKTVRAYARISPCFCIWKCSTANKDQIWALVNRNIYKALIHSLKALLAAARKRTVHVPSAHKGIHINILFSFHYFYLFIELKIRTVLNGI